MLGLIGIRFFVLDFLFWIFLSVFLSVLVSDFLS